MGVFCFVCWYFPIGLYRNAEYTDQVHSRGITIFLFVTAFFILTSTFGQMVIAGLPNPDIGGGVLTLLFIMMFAFCGYVFRINLYRCQPEKTLTHYLAVSSPVPMTSRDSGSSCTASTPSHTSSTAF